jgi:hypothetical protein
MRNLNGAETWVVVVKATFDVDQDGVLRVSREQPPPARVPCYRGEPGRSSIEYDADFVLDKNTTDIVVNGHAYAPAQRRETVVDVSFQVGAVVKRLRVFGNRSWTLTGTPTYPDAFERMPLIYERAFGGVDLTSDRPEVDWYWPNPVGTGFAVSDRGLTHLRLPNVEYPDDPTVSWNSRPRPAGFGVVGPHWQARARFAGTYDVAWSDHRQPLLPTDFDLRHFQSVPEDQQAPRFLTGGEPVALHNLTPSGILRFRLPVLALRIETRFMDGERRPHAAPSLHSLILEPDHPRVSLVFHSSIECHHKVYKLDHSRVEAVAPQEYEDDDAGSPLDASDSD